MTIDDCILLSSVEYIRVTSYISAIQFLKPYFSFSGKSWVPPSNLPTLRKGLLKQDHYESLPFMHGEGPKTVFTTLHCPCCSLMTELKLSRSVNIILCYFLAIFHAISFVEHWVFLVLFWWDIPHISKTVIFAEPRSLFFLFVLKGIGSGRGGVIFHKFGWHDW